VGLRFGMAKREKKKGLIGFVFRQPLSCGGGERRGKGLFKSNKCRRGRNQRSLERGNWAHGYLKTNGVVVCQKKKKGEGNG